jgi:predicted nucleotidyltransferase component of viral defense system
MSNWKNDHGRVIGEFLLYLNKHSDAYILKGGTALMACYNLDRFSEDIDLDGSKRDIQEHVEKFCEIHHYTFRIAKDTDTVKRYMIQYGNAEHPLKLEISYRTKEFQAEYITNINGIKVYTIDQLCRMKSNAYIARDKIRDLYDVVFIYMHHQNSLSPQTVEQLKDAIAYKGIEQFDYIIRNQRDSLIDPEKLANNFLDMYDKLGLLYGRQMYENLRDDLEQEM